MKKVMFIASVGGHLTQILELNKIYNNYKYVLITEKSKTTKNLKYKYNTSYLLYGSRKKLYKIIFPFIVIINSIISIFYFLKYNPDVIVTTGTHACVPMCYIASLFKRKIIFIESYARKKELTMSAKMIYPIATSFIVQSKYLKTKYKKSLYFGSVY